MAPSESEDEVEANEEFDLDDRSSEADPMGDEEAFDGDDNADEASEVCIRAKLNTDSPCIHEK